MALAAGLELIQGKPMNRQDKSRIWVVFGLIGTIVLGLFGIVFAVWKRTPGPADTLDVLSARWVNPSQTTAEVVLRLRRADGRPAMQGLSMGLVTEPRLYKSGKFVTVRSGSQPVTRYTLALQRRPTEPLVIKAASHPDPVYDSRGNLVPSAGEVCSRTVVVPLGSPDVTQ